MASEGKCVGGMILPYLPCFTWFFLLYDSIKRFKLIFLNQSPWLKTMYAEHWRQLAWATFLENFSILFAQQFNTLLCFQSKISFNRLFGFSSAVLLSKMKSLFLNFYTNSLWTRYYFKYLLPLEVCANW